MAPMCEKGAEHDGKHGNGIFEARAIVDRFWVLVDEEQADDGADNGN